MDGQMKREGIVAVTVLLGDIESPTEKAQVIAPFIFEDGEWRCDFARLEETDPSKITQEMSGE